MADYDTMCAVPGKVTWDRKADRRAVLRVKRRETLPFLVASLNSARLTMLDPNGRVQTMRYSTICCLRL